jgi:uncharacterized protein YjbI with pentapeptide repeats
VERVRMPDALTEIADKVAAPLKASAIVLPMALILITVVSQADTELIRPDTRISLEKISLPSGTLFTPLLGLKLSVFSFYAVAPLIVFVLHWMLLRLNPATDEPWAKSLRMVGTVLAPVTLFALLWRFSPYAHARPNDVPGISAGLGLSYLHAAFLAADTVLILYGRLENVEWGAAPWGSHVEMAHRLGLALRAFVQAGLLFLPVFMIATIVAAVVRLTWDDRTADAFAGVPAAAISVVGGVLIVIVSWPAFIAMRRLSRHMTFFQSLNPDIETPRGASMSVYSVLLTALVASVALPDLGRPLNFAGARLAAAEPSDAIVAAMIASPKVGPENARGQALKLFGRGLDYTKWQFAHATFDGAIMPLITLNEADLSGASLIRAEMIGSKLLGANLAGAILSEADLSDADLSCANVAEARNCLTMVQAQQKAAPGAADRPRTNADPTTAAPATSDACTVSASRTGPVLNKAILAGATLTRADLSNAKLRSVDFSKVKDMTDTKFVGADLTGATFKDALKDVIAADFSNACLCGADLSKLHLENAVLSGAVLRGADLRGTFLPANLKGIDFTGAAVKDTTFTGEPPNLQDSNLLEASQAEDFKPVCSR